MNDDGLGTIMVSQECGVDVPSQRTRAAQGVQMPAGYLVVTRFEVLYADFIRGGRWDKHLALPKAIYGIPHASRPVPGDTIPHYLGIDREALGAMTFGNTALFSAGVAPCAFNRATAMLEEIEIATHRQDGWVTERDAVRGVWDALGNDREKYEIIFGKDYEDSTPPPQDAKFLGCDAAYFVRDHFSCICDALFFPKWHGTDSEGVLFREYFDKLNRNGLFGDSTSALDYLRYYLSFDWTERDDKLTSIEVYGLSTTI